MQEPDGTYVASRDDWEARLELDCDGRLVIGGFARRLGEQRAVLVDAGYQKFWVGSGGQCRPALAAELGALHNFELDLRDVLELPSYYNISLGTVNARHLYDRLKGRPAEQGPQTEAGLIGQPARVGAKIG